jgi:hypothetical protein
VADQVSVEKILKARQRELLVKLNNDRELRTHPTDLGDATELDWAGVLEEFLPKRYQVARASVLDAYDQLSDVLDVVIFDRQYCPLWLGEEGTSQHIPAESVYGVFEVKQEFDATNIDYAAEKVASVRRLHRTAAKIVHAGGRIDTPKEPFPIIGGINASESTWEEPLGPYFEKAVLGEPPERQLDLGCALRDGAFDVERGGHETIVRSKPEDALMFFLVRLFSRLQALGTVSAIDMNFYARGLEDQAGQDGDAAAGAES